MTPPGGRDRRAGRPVAAVAGLAAAGGLLLAGAGQALPAPDAGAPPGSRPPPAPPAAPAAARSAPTSHTYLDGPPPGHTGGFDEPACQRCHFDAPVNPPEASLALEGFPERFTPDSVYRLTLRVAAPDLGAAGFEAAVRCAGRKREGRQAGELAARSDRAEVVPGGGGELEGDSTVLYARHTREGSRPTAPGAARWELAWTAPEGCRSAVLHAAANAANGDASEFGDRVLTGSWTAEPSGVGTP